VFNISVQKDIIKYKTYSIALFSSKIFK